MEGIINGMHMRRSCSINMALLAVEARQSYTHHIGEQMHTFFLLLLAPDRQISGVNSNCIDYEFVIASSKNTQEGVLP